MVNRRTRKPGTTQGRSGGKTGREALPSGADREVTRDVGGRRRARSSSTRGAGRPSGRLPGTYAVSVAGDPHRSGDSTVSPGYALPPTAPKVIEETVREHGIAIVLSPEALEDLLDLEEARQRVAEASDDDWVAWDDVEARLRL